MTPKRSRRRYPRLLHLTAEERDLLLLHAPSESGIADVLTAGRQHGALIWLVLDDDALDEFLVEFEQVANNAQELRASERLGQALSRIEAGLAGEADPGWPRLRPALAARDISVQQAQYLAFIATYIRLNGRAPAESELQAYFGVTAPTVHSMLTTLRKRGFIARVPGVARSIRLLLPAEAIPELE